MRFVLENQMVPLSDVLGIRHGYATRAPAAEICKVHRFPPGRYTRTCTVCGISEEKDLGGELGGDEVSVYNDGGFARPDVRPACVPNSKRWTI